MVQVLCGLIASVSLAVARKDPRCLDDGTRPSRSSANSLRARKGVLQAGVPPKVVSERLGHSTVAFTMDVYAHVIPGMQADAAETFGQLVFGGTDADPVDVGGEGEEH